MSNHDMSPDPDDFELRRRLRQLPREREPAHELWPGIASRLEAVPRVASRRRHWALLGLAAAASLALAVGAMLRSGTPAITPDTMLTDAPRSGMPGTNPGASANLMRLEADALTIEYRVAIGAFAGAPFPPELRAAATELDASARQIRTALREQPDAPYLLDRLRRTYDQRLKLTQRAVLG